MSHRWSLRPAAGATASKASLSPRNGQATSTIQFPSSEKPSVLWSFLPANSAATSCSNPRPTHPRATDEYQAWPPRSRRVPRSRYSPDPVARATAPKTSVLPVFRLTRHFRRSVDREDRSVLLEAVALHFRKFSVSGDDRPAGLGECVEQWEWSRCGTH